MNNANVKLSKTELSLVTDAAIILTKNSIIAKVYDMFGGLSEELLKLASDKQAMLPPEALAVSPKIYRGEQYLGLPYVMMDYPRHYNGKDVIAIRCLFWWGNFFSITLHLGGKFVPQYKNAMLSWIKRHSNAGWFICVNNDAWQHHFEGDNYQPLLEGKENIPDETLLNRKEFVKLAKKIPLQQWDGALSFFATEYKALLQVFEA